MLFFYTFLIRFYHFLVTLASPFNQKAKLFTKGRADLLQKIQRQLENDVASKIWVHCASLGEFEQGRPLIESLKRNHPSVKIILTFFSPSGYEIKKNYNYADYVFYLPADTPSNARRFLSVVKPRFVLFVKYEFWLNYLYQLHENKTPTLLISAIFRPNQHFFKWYGKLFRRTLFFYDKIAVQNEDSLTLLQNHGITSAVITGDTRFDRVLEVASAPKKIELIQQLTENKTVIIAGSSWPTDETFILKAFYGIKKTIPDLVLIVAPHETHEKSIIQLINQIKQIDENLQIQKFTEGLALKATDIIVIDTIGLLSSLYQYGKIACIGGGFGSGIHNISEALVYGLPVLFGPNHKKFNEAHEAIKQGFGFTFSNEHELKKHLELLISDTESHLKLQEQAKNYIIKNSGSTQLIMNYIEDNLLKTRH